MAGNATEIKPENRQFIEEFNKGKSKIQKKELASNALDAVRQCAESEKATYDVDGRDVPTAKTNISALMEAGGSLAIVRRTHTPDYIEVVARATIPNILPHKTQSVESSYSVYKQEYLAKKAWDWVLKHAEKDPELVEGVNEFGMPQLKSTCLVKMHFKDDIRNGYKDVPAQMALWKELAKDWDFASRIVETKAMSRASNMILRMEFREREEIQEEEDEIKAVADRKKS